MPSSSVVVIGFLLFTLIALSEQRVMKKDPFKCYGAPPAKDICINFLAYNSQGECTGLTCDLFQWYDCLDGVWVLATMAAQEPLNPDCWFDDLDALCDCPKGNRNP
jgi:hypothetical protein